MTENKPSQGSNKGLLLRVGVIGVGVVVFVLLLFADKTNLNNPTTRTLEAGAVSATPLPSGKLPPLAPDPQLNEWISELDKAEGDRRTELLDSIIARLEARNRFEYAAQYAGQWVETDSSLETLIRAGKLYQAATRLDYVAQDSGLFRSFSDQSIALLEKATRLDDKNEEALYHLGMAYVESREQQYSMQGILTIRKVLELNPDNAEAGFSLGMFSIQTGQYEKAEQRFSRILENDPNYYPAKYYLAYSRIQQQKNTEVQALLEDVLKNAKDPELKQMAKSLLNNI